MIYPAAVGGQAAAVNFLENQAKFFLTIRLLGGRISFVMVLTAH